jgi:CDP-paratose 2-epimerase
MKAVTILGGAGFIGSNLAHRLLLAGEQVQIFDNLSSVGVLRNIEWLRRQHDSRFVLSVGDIRDGVAVSAALANTSAVYHFAAQVGVAKSIDDPLLDFDINARGTLNVLQAMRRLEEPAPLFFASTTRIYGALSDVPLGEALKRYEPLDDRVLAYGFSEARSLDFTGPGACSKGAADQYVVDSARTYGLSATALRMSSIYGPRQHGCEDHGWIAHFLKRSLTGEPVAIHGTGKQVRDVLFVDDLVEALLLARKHSAHVSGGAFNIGGGVGNTLSVLELVDVIEELTGERPQVIFVPERTDDARYYVADTRRFRAATGWSAQVDVRQGLRELYLWLSIPYERHRRARVHLPTPS